MPPALEGHRARARVCTDCGQVFVITGPEQEWLADLVTRGEVARVVPPKRCLNCRRERRRHRYAVVDDGLNEQLTCVTCGGDFLFGGRDKAYWAANGWLRPRRCRPCREARRQGA